MEVEAISAITLWVESMRRSVQFYRDILGMTLIYGGENSHFTSLRAKHSETVILNLQEASPVPHWGRLIFYVPDVDDFWRHLKSKGFYSESPRDATWGERYFHFYDPDGHELSFAHPIR
jgi:catechol 2,3-dioxygenase-like lactoylglutathione lyase family enzyme